MKKFFSVFLLVFILALLLAEGMQPVMPPVLMEENVERAYENVLCSAVRIQGNGHYGSGSIFEIDQDNIIIVTNKHVLQYFDADSYVTFFHGAQGKGRVIYCSETADIGFISISPYTLTSSERKSLKSVRKQETAYWDLEVNSRFFMIDMASDSAHPVWYPGTVLDKGKFLAEYNLEMLYGDGKAVPGMSGSGIFDYYGNYIATLSGATEQYELAGVPLQTVLEEYEKCMEYENLSSYDGNIDDYKNPAHT